jgi:hypothetical protein
MTLEKRAVKKWTLITLFCGAHSFFWAVMAQGSVFAIIAGLITLILMFSLIESHPTYQAKRSGNPLFARAMDMGIKIRMYFAAYILFIGALMLLGAGRLGDTALLMIVAFPYMAEIWIGMGASLLCTWLTGTSLEGTARKNDYTQSPLPASSVDNIIATYTTTLITGLLHTIILALICGVVYLVLRRRKTL